MLAKMFFARMMNLFERKNKFPRAKSDLELAKGVKKLIKA